MSERRQCRDGVRATQVPPPASGRRWGSTSTNSEDDDLYGSTLILERSALYKKAEGKLMEALRIREDGNGSHLDVAQVAVSLGSLTVEMAIFDAARAFFDLALRNYTFDESADAHPRAVRSRRPVVQRRLHAVEATRVHQTRSWVVFLLSLRPFGPNRDAPRRSKKRATQRRTTPASRPRSCRLA